MSHFAKVMNGVVVGVLVADRDVIDSGLFGDPALWVQTSYNTRGGQHPEGRPLRKNFAGIGFTYDPVLDAFYAPEPYPSWALDIETCLWVPPVPHPEDGKPYVWNEDTLSWVETVPTAPITTDPDPVIAEPEAPVVEAALSTVTSSVGN